MITTFHEEYRCKDDLESEIDNIWNRINQTLEESDNRNELFVFDFTFVLHRHKILDVNSTYKYIHSEYPDLLAKFLKNGQALLRTNNTIILNLANPGGKGRLRRSDLSIEKYKGNFPETEPIDFKTWHQFLKDNDYGGCSFIVFNRLSLKKGEEIELGIYCVFENPIEHKTQACNYLKLELERFLLTTGQKFALQHYLDQVEKQAIRAAVSQVMVRCFSHNIASHVLSKYKSEGDFLSLEMFKQIQYLAEQLQLNLDFKNYDKIFEIAATQRAYFNEYIKNRMDFLADIATVEYPTLESPLFIKNDILRGLDKNRILLNRISGLDSGVEFDINLKLPPGKKDILVAVPNDVLGCHAFYIILENIIRNIAKHSKEESDSNSLKFTITIELSEYKTNPNYYEVKIFDDLPKNQEKISDLVVKRNNHFNNKIIDKSTNRLRDTALGSIEMDVCAAYLRKLTITSIEDDLYTVNDPDYFKTDENGINIPNLIHAYAELLTNENFSLGYKIYLRKPQNLLILDDKLLGKNKSELVALRNEGLTILTRLSFKNFKFDPEDEYGHEFLIWLNDSEELTKFYQDNKSILPVRVLKKEDFVGGFQLKETSSETKEKVWDIYLNKYLKEKQITGYDIQQVNRSIPAYPEICEKNNKIYIDDHDKQWNSQIKEGSYYEMCCSHNRLSKMNLYWDSQDRMRYIESAACKVLLIDERIQANIVNSNKKYRDNVNFKEYFDNLNIIIPSKDDVNLNKANFGFLNEDCKEDSEAIACRLKHYIRKKFQYEKIDFCVIHLGIIEKFFGETEDKSETEISNKIKLLVDENNLDKIIITSGRGKPDNLANTFRYIPLAVIQNYVETLFDKILLVNALYNSRKAK